MIGTFTNEISNRSVATDYQNTSEEDLWIIVSSGSASGGGSTFLEIGVSTSTYETVSYFTRPNISQTMRWNVSGIVPPDYYYRVSSSYAAQYWWEYETPASSGMSDEAFTNALQENMATTNLFLGAFLFLASAALMMMYFKGKR